MFALETRDGRTRVRRSRSTPSSCGCATTRRSTRRRPPVVQRRAGRVSSPAAPSCSAGPSATPTPRSRRDGDWLIGTGMAAAGVPGRAASCRRSGPGPASTPTAARSCRPRTQEFGTGVADDGHPGRRGRARRRAASTMQFQAGDTDLPNITAAVGSAGAGMVSSAVHAAGDRAARTAHRAWPSPTQDRRCTVPTRPRVDRRGRAADVAERPDAARPTPSCSPATTCPTPRRSAAWTPAAARHAARAADLRRPVRRGRRRPGPRTRPRPPAGRRLRTRAGAQPASSRAAS